MTDCDRRRVMTTANDLRNWVDGITSDWINRTDADVEAITSAIREMDHPHWGADWSAFLDALPNLVELRS